MAARDYELLLKISADIRNAVGPLNKLSRELRQSGDQGAKSFDKVNKSLANIEQRASSVKSLLVGAFAIGGIDRLVRSLTDTNIQFQQAEFTLRAATGSAKQAGAELDFVRSVSDRLGLSYLDAAKQYARLAAAAKETPQLGSKLHSIFTALAETSSVLHFSSDKMQQVMYALDEMISKGKVQSRQLVRQLTINIPGAMQLAANATHMTTAELTKQVTAGRVLTKDFLPAFAAELHKAYGPTSQESAHSLNAEINRLHNSIVDLEVKSSQRGFLPAFTNSVRTLAETLRSPAVQQGFGAFLTGLGNLITFSLKGISALSGLARAVSDIFSADGGKSYDQMNLKYSQLGDVLGNLQTLRQRTPTDQRNLSGKLQVDVIDQQIKKTKEERAQLLKVIEARRRLIALGREGGQSTGAPSVTDYKFPALADPKAATKTNNLAAAQKQLADTIDSLGSKTLGPVSKLWNDYATAVRRAAEAGGKAIAAGADPAQVQQQVAKAVALANDARTKALGQLHTKLQLSLYKATGQAAAASRIEIEQQYGQLERDLIANGDIAGAALVHKLIPVLLAKKQMTDLFQQVARVQADQQRGELNIQAEQNAGLKSEYEARKEILDLHQRTAAQLQQMLPTLRAAAAATGDPAAIQRVKDLSAQIDRLKLQANDLKVAFDSGLTSGLENALNGLATGAYTVAGAFRALAQSIISSLTQVAARALAAKAISGLASLFGGGNKDAGKSVSDGAIKLALASIALGVNASKLQAAATTLLIANAAGSAGGSAGGIAGLFATGGEISGPGTGTSDSVLIRASSGEFMQRTAAVDYYGLPFMHAINQLRLPRFATGGPISAAAGRLPARSTPRTAANAPASSSGTASAPSIRIVNVVDPKLVGDYLHSGAGRDAVLNIISENRSSVRQQIGG